MTYWLINLVFLLISGGITVVCMVRRPRVRTRIRFTALAVALAVALVLTAVFDNVMIAVGLFDYSVDARSGLAIGLAPIEDFAYPVAAVLLLPALWELLGGARAERDRHG